MTQFTPRAIDIDNAVIEQGEINESHRQAQEFGSNSSDDNGSISSQERYIMNQKQEDK